MKLLLRTAAALALVVAFAPPRDDGPMPSGNLAADGRLGIVAGSFPAANGRGVTYGGGSRGLAARRQATATPRPSGCASRQTSGSMDPVARAVRKGRPRPFV